MVLYEPPADWGKANPPAPASAMRPDPGGAREAYLARRVRAREVLSREPALELNPDGSFPLVVRPTADQVRRYGGT